MVQLSRDSKVLRLASSNTTRINEMRAFLERTAAGSWRFTHVENRHHRRVYTHLYLEDAMDLAMIKLTFADDLFKIYRVDVQRSSGSSGS